VNIVCFNRRAVGAVLAKWQQAKHLFGGAESVRTIEIRKTSAGTIERQRASDPGVANRRLSQPKGAEGQWRRIAQRHTDHTQVKPSRRKTAMIQPCSAARTGDKARNELTEYDDAQARDSLHCGGRAALSGLQRPNTPYG